ncbi:MAG: ABC transporter permease [Limnochordia bacterium]|jgi:peptide/nickel transport system permease protein|nr:ABC transporter permease [Bacillota bacterium]NLL08202.1 ABC transporter permease [Bacillota bacterium]HBG10007.1 peptide ABC transporter permease [Bacillota bacterium]
MGRYLSKKVLIYLITFFFAVTLNWAVPRFAPGDPISMLLSRFVVLEGGRDILESFFVKTFGLDQPLLQQYFGFWRSLFRGDLGISISQYPKPVLSIIRDAIIYDIIILVPAIVLSWIIGNKLGAFSGVSKKADNFLMPVFYFLTSSPYFWFALLVSYLLGIVLGIFPTSHAYSATMRPGWNLAFIADFFMHWFMPFLTLFLVQLGGWAIGMRNMIIYETNTNYAKYMESLGARERLIRRYGFRNGILPQVTGLAISLGTVVSGAVLTQMVFSYPGLGYLMVQAIKQNDYFLIQGCFLFLIIMVLLANFTVDIIYMFIDPRVRHSYSGEV